MEPGTLHELVEKAMSLYPNRVAVTEDIRSPRHDIVYKELWRVSNIIADTISSIDVKSPEASQFIAVRMDQCLLYPAVILGILRQGFGFVCIEPTWTLQEQMNILQKLGISILIHTNDTLKNTSDEKHCGVEIMGTFFYFEKFNGHQLSSRCPHAMAYAVLTSGSTGDPKIVRVPHSSIVPNILSLRQVLNISCEDVIFLSSPSTFDPSIVDVFLALSTGASLLVTSRHVKGSATSLLSVLFSSEYSIGVTVLQMTPSIFNRWSDNELKDVVFGPKTPLRALILGGEPFPPLSKFRYCEGLVNTPIIYNIYGVSEVSAWASIFQVIPSSNDILNTLACDKENPVPLGQPLSDTFFQVRDCTTGSIINTGCGEMFIGSSKRICEVDNENCLDYCPPIYRATGDIVQVYSNGMTFYIGRKDRTIKRWGHRINLENIEYIALNYPGVQSACCVWDELKHRLHLAVHAHEETFSQVALQKHFLQTVGSQKALVPDEITEIKDTSLTHHGKLNHQMVMKMLQTTTPTGCEDSVSKLFLELCAEALGLFSVAEGSFLHLGGNSILAMTLITRLETIFGNVPQSLPSLLLSGEDLHSISKMLLHHYDKRAGNSAAVSKSVTIKKESIQIIGESGQCVPVIPMSNSNHHLRQKSDKLISFSLRGRVSGEISPCFSLKQSSLCNITMNLSWKQDLGKCIDASPLCLEYESGVGIVIGSHSGTFSFFNGTTGEPRWSVRLPHRIESSACSSICGRHVYVGCYDGALYCICVISGKIIWSFCTSGMVKCAPALCNKGKSVIFGSYDYQVYCLNAESGQLEWSSSFGENGSWIASPLVMNGLAVLCSLASTTCAVQTSDGQVLWRTSFLHPIFSTPCCFSVASDTCIVADVKGGIHCLSVSSGRQVSSWQAPGYIFAPLTILSHPALRNDAKHLILVACYDQHVYALSVNESRGMSFSMEWKTNLGSSIGSAPFAFAVKTVDNVECACAAVVNSAGRVFILCLDSGEAISQYDVSSEVFSSPVVCRSRIYFGCRDNKIYSLEIN